MDKPIAKLKLLTTKGEVVDAILYCHQETTTIAGTTYYLLKLNTPADASGTTLSASTANTVRVVWGKFVYPLTGIAKILSATIYATYRAYTGGGTVNAEIDIKILSKYGETRATIAIGVSKSSNLGTSWATYTGANYSFTEYTVEDQTDYLEIDYVANVTAKKAGQYAYLRIDDNTLALADQTRSQEWKFTGVTTLSATNVTLNSATLNGKINGTETMTIRGFEWGKQSGNYTDSWTESGTFPPDTYSHQITNLDPNTTYYFRAKAYSDATGWIYGNELSFTTLTPIVTTRPATNITPTSATLNGETANFTATIRGFEWGKQSGNYTDSWTEEGSFPPSLFSHTISGLDPDTTYYFRAKAYSPETGWIYGSELSFSTPLGAGTVVGSSTALYALFYPFQRKCFCANGRFWVFYSDGTNMVYSTSTDGLTWSSPTTVRPCDSGGKFSVWFDGTYVHYAYSSEEAGSPLYYRRGTLSGSSIIWDDEQVAVPAVTGVKYRNPAIAIDSNGYPWIGYVYTSEVINYPYVTKSSTKDGSWTTENGFPFCLEEWAVDGCFLVPLTEGKMLALYSACGTVIKARSWNGSSWNSAVATTSNVLSNFYESATNVGDDVHLVFLKQSPYDLIHTKYVYSSNSFTSETTIIANTTPETTPVLSKNPTTNELHCFWATKITGNPSGAIANHIYFQKSTDGGQTWSSFTNWLDETSEVLTSSSFLTCFYEAYDNKIGLAYMTKTASPYNVKFAFLTVIVAVAETIVAKNFPMDYLPSPTKATQLTSKVSGATITKNTQDYPLTLLKKDKAQELKTKWT